MDKGQFIGGIWRPAVPRWERAAPLAVLLWVCLLFTSLLLSGCGGGGTSASPAPVSSNPSAAGGNPAPAPAPTPPPAPTPQCPPGQVPFPQGFGTICITPAPPDAPGVALSGYPNADGTWTLQWQLSNEPQCNLDPTGSVVVSPAVATTYAIYCTTGGGKLNSEITIDPAHPPLPSAIGDIVAGSFESGYVTIGWDFANDDNAGSCYVIEFDDAGNMATLMPGGTRVGSATSDPLPPGSGRRIFNVRCDGVDFPNVAVIMVIP